MQDRVPTPGKENRVRIRLDDGQTIEGVFEYADEATVQGSAYNKANVLPDSTCSTLELPTSAEPKDAFEHATLPEYGLRIGDLIGSERGLPASFLSANGGGASRELYPDLYKLLGTKYGFSRTVTRYKNLRNTEGYGNDQVSSGRMVCNKSGVYVLIFSLISSTSEREMSAIGVISKSKNAIFRQESSVGNLVYFDRICACFDDSYLYVFEGKRDSIRVLKFGTGGLVKSDTFDTFSESGSYISSSMIDGHPHIIVGDTLYKVDKDSLTWTRMQTLTKNSNFGIGKAGKYYFNGGFRGTAWNNMSSYSIPGVSSGNGDFFVKQVSDGVLVFIRGNTDKNAVYKTTNGTSFTKLCTNFDLSSHTAFSSDGVHHFEKNTKIEKWFKSIPSDLNSTDTQATLSRKILVGLDVDYFTYSSTIETEDGYIVPYLISDEKQGIGVQLVPKDFLFNLPTYDCGGKYLKIKVKKTGV